MLRVTNVSSWNLKDIYTRLPFEPLKYRWSLGNFFVPDLCSDTRLGNGGKRDFTIPLCF